ncbi:hypothetical protein NIES2098_61930 [Calothrix sp. NIES-2098]|nr:hypothetical protein NIES2098_61930 [Calothrix sp. NIES-2098]
MVFEQTKYEAFLSPTDNAFRNFNNIVIHLGIEDMDDLGHFFQVITYSAPLWVIY